ncbi:MAG TPA: aminotransferase class I/II-fold pyridoxal phosphate-dependent enzyme, partial [Planctomycetaceae bacterium]|nr:aminotransferase class I/II-fold pyridoxal phosphate-dependent enzyme [Planctomycetaceae bacterium]
MRPECGRRHAPLTTWPIANGTFAAMTSKTCETSQAGPPRFSQRRWFAAEQAISFLMREAVENRDVISLAAGLVDQETLPVEATREAFERLFADTSLARAALQYGTTAGAERLRVQIARHLARLERCSEEQLAIDLDQIILTTGSQQTLALIADLMLDPGDICLVAAPTYFVFLGTVNGVGARAVPVRADAHGMRMDALEETLSRLEQAGELERVKLIYVVSYYENPTGVSLAPERRRQIVDIARCWSR